MRTTLRAVEHVSEANPHTLHDALHASIECIVCGVGGADLDVGLQLLRHRGDGEVPCQGVEARRVRLCGGEGELVVAEACSKSSFTEDHILKRIVHGDRDAIAIRVALSTSHEDGDAHSRRIELRHVVAVDNVLRGIGLWCACVETIVDARLRTS